MLNLSSKYINLNFSPLIKEIGTNIFNFGLISGLAAGIAETIIDARRNLIPQERLTNKKFEMIINYFNVMQHMLQKIIFNSLIGSIFPISIPLIRYLYKEK
jgi:hypothetical protein